MAEVAHVYRFNVGPWTCTVSARRPRPDAINTVCCEWTPSVPDRAFTAAEDGAYRQGLAEALTAASSTASLTHPRMKS